MYFIAVAPNFYGFLNKMGVQAPLSIQRYYYVAYPTGLLIAFSCYCVICCFLPPEGMERSKGWKEPEDYIDEFDRAGEGLRSIESIEVAEHGRAVETTEKVEKPWA